MTSSVVVVLLVLSTAAAVVQAGTVRRSASTATCPVEAKTEGPGWVDHERRRRRQLQCRRPPADAIAACPEALALESQKEGPFWVDEPELNTPDLRRGAVQGGVPLSLTFRALNKSTCQPEPDVKLDIWQSRYDGLYSDMAVEDTQGQNWLRGYQFTNAQGYAAFHTIFPGWYARRTPHIHLRLRVYGKGNSLVYDTTTQLYFDDELSQDVYENVGEYKDRGSPSSLGRDTYNSHDYIFSPTNLIALRGSYKERDGYHGDVVLTVPL